MKIYLSLAILMISFLFGSSAHAGLFVCNNTGIKLSVAVGYSSQDIWQARGWYNIEPRECALPIEGLFENTNVYYYAEGYSDSSIKWQGGEKSASFCVHKYKAFHYADGPGCLKYNFKHIDVGSGDAHYTLNLAEGQTSPLAAAQSCAHLMTGGRDAFAKCWIRQVATHRQSQILNCLESTDNNASFAVCAAKGNINADAARIVECTSDYNKSRQAATFVECLSGGKVGSDTSRIINCVIDAKGNATKIALCSAGKNLSSEQRRIIECVANNRGYADAGMCIASGQLNNEQRRIVGCVVNNRNSYVGMGVCAAGRDMTPEQQVFVQCAVSTGGEPYSFVGCVGTQLTTIELDKCFTRGVGGSGCFGDNNSIVSAVKNAWKDVTKGPGPSNDLVGRDGFVMRNMNNAWNDITRGPGENNEICRHTSLC